MVQHSVRDSLMGSSSSRATLLEAKVQQETRGVRFLAWSFITGPTCRRSRQQRAAVTGAHAPLSFWQVSSRPTTTVCPKRHEVALRQRKPRRLRKLPVGGHYSLCKMQLDGNRPSQTRRLQVSTAVGALAASAGSDGLSAPPWPPLTGLAHDIAKRAPHFWGDWSDGLCLKSLAAILFLYFACLAPIVAFGGITAQITNGAIGVVEFLVSGSICGMIYHTLAGQPLTIVGPTGLTLAFTASLYKVCASAGLPFLPTYAWVGIWTAFFLFLLAIFNASSLIRYCTRFTDDCFNALIAATFLYEAFRSIGSNFRKCGMDKTEAFMSLSLSLGTFIVGRTLSEFRQSRYLRRTVREGANI